MNYDKDFTLWHPSEALHLNSSNLGAYSVLVLNHPLGSNLTDIAVQQWKKAFLRVAVDGGTNLLYRTFKDSVEELNPHVICGDLDSIFDDILQYYKEKGVNVMKTLDQDETDFTKALRVISEHKENHKATAPVLDCVIAICSSGGRLDHVLGNIDTLFHASNIISSPVYLLSEQSFSWLLPKGKHNILIPDNLKDKHCGLVPVGKPCSDISTTGLQWNLDHGCLEFGQLISTCNKYDLSTNFVSVETDTSVLWTMEL